jgi:hypothetical protein
MKKPSKTVSVQLPTEDVEALESLIGTTQPMHDGETIVVKRLSDAIRIAMASTIQQCKWALEAERKKAEKAEQARLKREAKKAAVNVVL